MSYKRIVSLVPSLTELIIELGLSGRVVGRTRFCIHPEDAIKEIPIIGGTKNPDIEKTLSLKPDLVIANKEENRKKDIQQLREQCEVLVTEINTIEDALIWIDDLGRKLEAQDLSQHLLKEIQLLLPEENEFSEIPTAYFIWKDPWMTIGQDTYIHNVMKKFGLLNVFGDDTRYPETTLKELKTRYPRVILLSSEPYPFKEKHIQEIQKEIPDASIQLIDGEWFSWYGSRMLPSFKALRLWREKLNRR